MITSAVSRLLDMLNASDIIHAGLKDIHATGTPLYPAPPSQLVRHCYRRLYALGVANVINSSSFLGMRVITVPNISGSPAYEMPVSNNKITFGWNAGYAVQVD